MEFLANDNMAAIIEALRSEKWGKQLFPLYISHKNHVIRYEIACSSFATEDELRRLSSDGEVIVRQAAHQNLLTRKRPLPTLAVKVDEERPKAGKDVTEVPMKEDKKSKRKLDRSERKAKKQKDKKNE